MNPETAKILEVYSELPDCFGTTIRGVNTRYPSGDFPINIAATRGNLDEVVTLLDAGSDINSHGEHGYTPLHSAVEQGHLNLVLLLLQRGADPGRQTDGGDTPMELAKLLGETAIYEVLKKR